MSDYNDLVEAFRYIFGQKLQKRLVYESALLGDGNGNIDVEGVPDTSWVRSDRGGNRAYPLFNKRVDGSDGLPILIGELPWQPGLKQVISVDWQSYERADWDSFQGTNQHGENHVWDNQGNKGTDTFTVYRRQIGELKTIPFNNATGTFSVTVTPYYLSLPDGFREWPGVPVLDLSGAIPSNTNEARYMLVYWHHGLASGTTGSLGVVSGTIGPNLPSYPLEYPLLPDSNSNITSAYVKLYNGQVRLQESDIKDARPIWTPPNGSGSELWSEEVSTNNIYYSIGNVSIGDTGYNPLTSSYDGLYISADIPQIALKSTASSLEGGMFAHSNTILYAGTWTNNQFRIRVNNSDKMTFHTNGNVGIDTLTPSELLQVGNGTTASIQATYTGIYVNHTGNAHISVRNDTSSVEGGMFSHSGGFVYMGAWTNNGLILRTNNIDSVIIDTSQNVGIGVTSAGSKVYIRNSDTTAYTGVVPNISVCAIGFSSTAGHVSGGVTIGTQYNINSDGENRVNYFGVLTESASTRNTSFVWTTDDNGSRTEKMRLTGSGDLRIGSGTTTPSKKLHVQASGSSLPALFHDGLLVQNNGTTSTQAIIDLIGGNAGNSRIHFGDTDNSAIGYIDYNHSDNSMAFRVNANERMRISSGGIVFINDTTDTFTTQGLVVNQGSNSDSILTFKNGLVGHGVTSITETDTYGTFKKIMSTAGGLEIRGFCDADDAAIGVRIQGIAGLNADTTTTTGSSGVVEIASSIKSGTTIAALNTGGNIAVFRTQFTTRFIFQEDGTGYADVAWTTFSDQRLKTNIHNLPYDLNTVLGLNPVRYNRIIKTVDENGVEIDEKISQDYKLGFIAQEVLPLIPEVVSDINPEESYYSISYDSLIPVLVKAIQELNQKIEDLEQRLN